MQAMILAAGMGRRLRAYTKDNTKCMVEVNGKRIIDHLMESLQEAACEAGKIDRLIIVTGYEGEKLKDYISQSYPDPGFELVYVDNPDYAKTNNIYSLYLASSYLAQDDTILLESDILFDHSLIRDLLEDPRKDLAVVDRFRHFMDGTMVMLDEDEHILTFIPKSDFSFEAAADYYKTVNIYKLSAEFCTTYYLPFLQAYIDAYGHNEYYEQVLRVIAFLPDTGLHAFKMDGRKWYEVDNAQDLDIACQIFSQGPRRSQSLASRYGGYWRFDDMVDFCYLVNPYFPPERLTGELRYMFDDLLRNYPSGLNTQNLLAAELFECSQDYILTGNGAAELIKGLCSGLKGKTGMVFPSFNEYAERIEGELVPFYPESPFAYGVSDVLRWFETVDNFILINPDNPSGNFISFEALKPLLAYSRESGKTLIVDESFLDFAVQDDTRGLIRDEILAEHPNLVVIKSISKSYGVPGLRLGVLASSNRDVLARVRSELAIWNINSFAEFFLQIYPKYAKHYASSCRKIADERERFSLELQEIPGIQPLPSKANYILCTLEGIASGTLRDRLIEDYGLFIKDLRGKQGVPESLECIRIAVRDKADDDRMLTALREIFQADRRA